MKVIDKDRVQIRVRIEGEYKGEKWVYEDAENEDGSQYIWINADTDDEKCSSYWWRGGNMGCDCNRNRFLTNSEMNFGKCGHEITINKIIPLEGDFPTLIVDGYEND